MRAAVVGLWVVAACAGDDGTDTDADTSLDGTDGTEADTEVLPIPLASFVSETSGFSNSTVAVTLQLGDARDDLPCDGGDGPAIIGRDTVFAEGDEGVFSYDAEDDGFAAVVACLTNGVDDLAQIVLYSDSGRGFTPSREEALGLGAPDLAGADITRIDIDVTNIAVQNVGSLIYDVSTETTIVGFAPE